MKITKAQLQRAATIRGELTKVRCWLTGYEAGTGKSPPGVDSLRQTQALLDELLRTEAASEAIRRA